MDCRAGIAAQDATYPTYKKIDCTLQTLENDDNFYGRLIDCKLAVITSLVEACKNWDQGIRTTVKISGEYVTGALVGVTNISRRKNQIATFSFQLNDTQYSPLTNPDIAPNREVIITSYLNRYKATLFTGLIDDVQTTWDGNFRVSINGSGYGKKLRDARKTLVSIQNSATSKYRGDLVKYLAEQGGIESSNIDTAQGSYTKVDHSFEDQSVLDMINKELIIDSMRWEFDEDKTFNTSLDVMKTSTETYPTPDWTYGEDRFFYLRLGNSDDNLINDVKILGTMYETQIVIPAVADGGVPADSPSGEYIEPAPAGYTATQLCNFNNSFGSGVSPTSWSASDGYFTLTVDDTTSGWWQPPQKSASYGFYIRWSTSQQDYEITSMSFALSGYVEYTKKSYQPKSGYVKLYCRRGFDGSALGAFSVSIGLLGKKKNVQTKPEEDPPVSAIIDNEVVSPPTYEYKYDQVAAHVENQFSIDRYGRRKPNSEGTLDFPFAENTNQCKGIGRKIIKDSHRFTKQPNFEVPFNPLLKVGQTVSITDSKIGYSQRWYVEEVTHTIEQGKGRTKIGCVYYA